MIRLLWPRLVQALLVVAVPVFLVVADVRTVTSHWFVCWEYGKADFPPDTFALSTEERVRLAGVCVDYLATDADISLLADLQLLGGAPAFNTRELRHMADVQVVFGQLTLAGVVAAAVLVAGVAALLASESERGRVPAALLGGGALTLVLLVAVGAYMALNWWDFFTAFHRLFFEDGTWTFDFSETLIRLFPARFWMDVAATIVGLLIVEAVAVGVAGWVWARRILPHVPAAQ